MIGSLRRRIHELARHILHEHTQPRRVALAVLVGCIVGCTPLFGAHIFVCIALAWLLRLNQVVVYGAANISVPPMIPLLGFVSVQLGERLLRGRFLALRMADFSWRNAPSLAKTFFVDWMVGGLLLGAVIGAVAGSAVWAILRARNARRARHLADPLEAAIFAASRRYDGLHRRYWIYARMKYLLDPCYRTIAPLVPPGALTVDLGCGQGMLPVLLALLGSSRRAIGVEWDPGKVRAGQHAAQALDGVEILEGDARNFAIPPCDVITLVDVLHYYDADAQRALLARCRAALRPGGKLLVREGDRQRAGGARWTRFVERLATASGFNRGPAVNFRPIADLTADLEALGFGVHADEVAGKLHPGNVLLVAEATRPAAASSSA